MKPGDVISERYRLLRLIDVGGMGEVWAARNELTRKHFAIKFLLPSLADRPDCLERFVREAEMAGRLDHPSIVNVFDVAQAEDGQPFIVMELLAGESLEHRVERSGPIPQLEAAAHLAQIADGLALAHAAGIVHRDLSAANVFLSRNPAGGQPVPKILDFGVSKMLGPDATDRTQTASGAVLGCPEFMSPEQARGAELVDARTDVWSLGAVLYVALAGTMPFHAKNYNALMVSILTRAHRPIVEVMPSVDPELAVIVEGCLAKDRERRIQSAREVSERLGAIARRLAGGSTAAVSPGRRATDRLPREGRRLSVLGVLGAEELRALSHLRPRSTGVGIASAVVGLLIGGLVAFRFARTGEDPPPPLPAPSHSRPLGATLVVPPSPEPSRAVVPADDESDLALAVARGLGVDSKSPGRR